MVMKMLDPVNVLLTSVGNDGFPAVLQALKSNPERDIRVIGVDIRPSAPGLYLADEGYLVPPRSAREHLLERLAEICCDERVSIIYPLSTEDQEFFASEAGSLEDRGISTVVSPLDALRIANDKLHLYEFARANGIPCADFESVRNLAELERAAYRLGFPEHPFVLKLNTGTGAQGLKVVYPSLAAGQRFLDRNNRDVAFHEVEGWLGALRTWPPLHLAEYLPGNEYSVDVLCNRGEVLSVVTRLRLTTLYGLALYARVVKEPDVQSLACELAAKLDLSFVVNVQVRRSADGSAKLMEVNPRIPGTIGLTVAAGVNMPYLALKMVLGEAFGIPQPRLGMIALRHWDAVYFPTERMLR
jgi:carbamoyl-phosphate synthase large subunit